MLHLQSRAQATPRRHGCKSWVSLLLMQELSRAISGTPIEPDRGGYTLTMREDRGAREVLEQLRANPLSGPALHLGWGSFRNLDIAAARHASHVLVCDINVHQLAVWRAVEHVLSRCATPQQFIERLPPELPTKPRLRQFVESTPEWLRGDLSRPESWLCTAAPERYEHLREVTRAGRLAFASLDLRGQPAGADGTAAGSFEALAAGLARLRSEKGVILDTLYISNIPYMVRRRQGFFGEDNAAWTACSRPGAATRSAFERMWDNLACIAQPETWLVRAERLTDQCTIDDPQWCTELARFGDARHESLARHEPPP